METKTMSFRDTIILAMSEEMRRDENIFLMEKTSVSLEETSVLLLECLKNLVQNVFVIVQFLKLPFQVQQPEQP